MDQKPAETSVHLPQGQDGQWRMAQIKEILVLVTSGLCSMKGSHPIPCGAQTLQGHLPFPLASPFHANALPAPHVLEFSFPQDSFLERGPPPRERSWES